MTDEERIARRREPTARVVAGSSGAEARAAKPGVIRGSLEPVR